MEIEVIRSPRKTMAIEVRAGKVILRAPLRATDAQIQDCLQKNRAWIQKHLTKAQAQQEALSAVQKLTMDEILRLADRALETIPARVRHFAPRVGVTYGRITIRNQRSKWGSCSGKGNLNFNCLLMLAPPQVLDSVVVHELCHRKEMNHSARFYAEVLRVMPDYRTWDRWLKENGGALMARMPGA